MSRILPHPFLSAALVLMWLMLTRFSLGHLLLGAVLATGAGLALSRIEPQALRVRSWPALLALIGVVFIDIVRSNWAVARLLLTKGGRAGDNSAFVLIPLRLTNPVLLAMLAVIVTATPGTAWIEYDRENGILLLHVFDMTSEEEWRAVIRDRYEARLMEAFQ